MYRVITYQTKTAHLRTTWTYAARRNEFVTQVVTKGGKVLTESSVENAAIVGGAVAFQQAETKKREATK